MHTKFQAASNKLSRIILIDGTVHTAAATQAAKDATEYMELLKRGILMNNIGNFRQAIKKIRSA